MNRKKYINKFGLYVCLVICISSLFVACKKVPNPGDTTTVSGEKEQSTMSNIPEEYTVAAPDADTYYEQNSEIVTVIDAQDSVEVLTEAETYTALTNRGFTQFPVTSSYSMGGEYYDAEDVETAGTDKHPMYETYYVTTNGNLWTIFMINGVTMANPVSYNLQSGLGVAWLRKVRETGQSGQFKSLCPCQESVIFEKRSPIFVFRNREEGRTALAVRPCCF